MDISYTKNELIKDLIASHKDMDAAQVEKAVEIVFEELATALVCGDRVELRGFGSLIVRKRGKGVARNPKNGLKVEVSDRGSLYFRASKDLIRDLNFTSANDN